MFSYHPASEGVPAGAHFTDGFRIADTDSVVEISEYMRRFAWSQSVFRDGYRRGDHFLFADWIGLDFDDPEMSLEQAKKSFCDMIHVIGTTRSHQSDKKGVVCDRFRVLLKPRRRIVSLAEYHATVTALAKIYPVDKQCLEGARHWFPCAQIVSISEDGYLADVIEGPKIHMKPARRYREHGMIRRRTLNSLRRFVPIGERHGFCFEAAKDLYDAGYDADEIYAALLRSPTYAGSVSPSVSKDICKSIRNGIRSVEKGLAYGRRDGSRDGTEEEREKRQGGESPQDGALPSDHREDERRSLCGPQLG